MSHPQYAFEPWPIPFTRRQQFLSALDVAMGKCCRGVKTNFLVTQLHWYEQRAFSASASAAQYQRVLLQGVQHVASSLRAPGTRARLVAQLPVRAPTDHAARNRALLALYANACGHLLGEAAVKFVPGAIPEPGQAQVNDMGHNTHPGPAAGAQFNAGNGVHGQGGMARGTAGAPHMPAVQIQRGGMQAEINQERAIFPGF